MAVTKKLVEDLEGIVGSKYVMDQDFTQSVYGAAGIFLMNTLMEVSDRSAPPDVTVKPRTTEEVSEILKLANETGTPVTVRGGGEGYWLGGSKDRGIMIDMTDMNKFIEYDEVSRTATFESGITWGALHTELEKYGVTCGQIGPHGLLGACVGGSIGADSPGAGGAMFGITGAVITNLKVVLPTGEVIRTGSLMNRETNYHLRYCNGPDLAGMFIGSGGIYGIITEVSFKTWPILKYSLTTAYAYPDFDSLCRSLYEAASYRYLAGYMGIPALGALEGLFGAMFGKGSALSMVALEASNETIQEAQKEEVDKIAKKYGGREVALGNLLGAVNFSILDRHGFMEGNLFHIIAPGSSFVTCTLAPLLKVPEIYAAEAAIHKKYEDSYAFSDLLGKHVWMCFFMDGDDLGGVFAPSFFSFDTTTPEGKEKAYRIEHELLEAKWRTGYATLFSNTREWQTPHMVRRYDPKSYELVKKIKESLDPNNILNRDFVIPTSPYEKVDKIIAEMEAEEVEK